MHYVSLDIGGTYVRYGDFKSFSYKSALLRKQPFIKSKNPYKEVEDNICRVVDAVSGPLGGIGISLAAVMNRENGKVKVWPNNPTWNQYDLRQHLKNKYKVPLIFEDDANCGAVGEYFFQAGNVSNFAYITIGTGVGCGLILNGSLYIGESGFAGELGHIRIGEDSICTCGNKGCFQSVVSGPGILNAYNSKAKSSFQKLEQVVQLYERGDHRAEKCISKAAEHISTSIYNIAMLLDISYFVIGGGVSKLSNRFISQIETSVNNFLIKFGRKVSVKASLLGEYSGVHGAVKLLQKSLNL